MNEPITKTSLAAKAAICLVYAYQTFLSPLLHTITGAGSGCRFHPTCSCYAVEAFRAHGFWRGLLLSVRRIGRCHPWSDGGLDPVPDLNCTCGDQSAAPYRNHLNG